MWLYFFHLSWFYPLAYLTDFCLSSFENNVFVSAAALLCFFFVDYDVAIFLCFQSWPSGFLISPVHGSGSVF